MWIVLFFVSCTCLLVKGFGNEEMLVEVVANKEVDGGFKFRSRIPVDNMCKNAKTYMGNTWHEVLVKANIDPPECLILPITVGEFFVDDYVIEYREFKDTGVYGKFDTCAYITYMGRRIGCARCLMEFDKQREEDDNEDDDNDYK